MKTKAKPLPLGLVEWVRFTPAPIVGVDEVGRGCLAGPVFAGAVHLKNDHLIEQMTDSKLLSEKKREELAPLIWTHHDVGIGFATVEEIDQMNILQASLLAMKRALGELKKKMGLEPGHILVDGNFKIPGIYGVAQTPIIKGDLRAAPISAASIVAKVARDQLMRKLDVTYLNQYGFSSNKGYGSETHRLAIQKWGPCPAHRRTFQGVKEFIS